MIPLIVISFSVFWLLLGYEIGRHRSDRDEYEAGAKVGYENGYKRGFIVGQHDYPLDARDEA